MVNNARPMDVVIGMEKGFSSERHLFRNQLSWLRDHGVTSVETYVLWKDIIPKLNLSQFDIFDRDLEELGRVGIRWVPFLIAGPWYSTPTWYLESPHNVLAMCLEHGQRTGSQSIWNPYLWTYIEEFLEAFHGHYDGNDIESILLGISGDYGEAIYPVTGNWPGEYHGHAGYWCGDEWAREAFSASMQQHYQAIYNLNRYWGSHYRNWSEPRPFVHTEAPSAPAWLDMVKWYRGSMTGWARQWLSKARELWPQKEIYFCTGGDMAPSHGSDFAQQAKLAAEFGAGIRITNEGSDFIENIMLTKLVTLSARYYGGFSGIEPASNVTPQGLAIRQFNATSSGAKQLHEYFYNVMDQRQCPSDFNGSGHRLEVWSQNYSLLKQRHPLFQVGLVLSESGLVLEESGIFNESLRMAASSLRRFIDFAVLDDTLIRDGILEETKDRIQLAILPFSTYWDADTLKGLKRFVESGGVLLSQGIPLMVEGWQPWMMPWTGIRQDTVTFRGMTTVEATARSHELAAVCSKIQVGELVSRLDTGAEALLTATYQPQSQVPLVAFWRQGLGGGASYFYTGRLYSTAGPPFVLGQLLRYISDREHLSLVAWETDEKAYSVSTSEGYLTMLMRDGETHSWMIDQHG